MGPHRSPSSTFSGSKASARPPAQSSARRVAILDTTLRDGEQGAGTCFRKRDKLEIAGRLAAMGVDVVEAGFPASSAAEAEAVAAVAAAVREAAVCALARAVPADVEAAGRALASAACPRIHVFVNSSDMHLAHQLRRSREQVVAAAEDAVVRARDLAAQVEFSPMDATRADPAFLAELVRAALRAGAAVVNLPDTVGGALPGHVAAMIQTLRSGVPELDDAVISFHGQDDLGLATANTLAAVAAGAGQVEVTVNGIGERAGNTSLEEVIAALQVHGGSLDAWAGVDPSGVHALSQLVAERSGIPLAPNKAVVGRNAFRHASGIHQDGVLKHRETYEVLDPRLFGHPCGSEIVLGKLSGRHGFAQRAARLGFALSGAGLDRAFARFQEVAAEHREVDDELLRNICSDGDTGKAAPGFALDL